MDRAAVTVDNVSDVVLLRVTGAQDGISVDHYKLDHKANDPHAAGSGVHHESAQFLFAGTSYQWGGITPWGADCSGFTQSIFGLHGIPLPRDSSQQAGCGTPVPLDDLRPGDLLFFRDDAGSRVTHVAFAGEADTLVHSTIAVGGMVQEPWLPGSRAASLRERLVAVRRLEER